MAIFDSLNLSPLQNYVNLLLLYLNLQALSLVYTPVAPNLSKVAWTFDELPNKNGASVPAFTNKFNDLENEQNFGQHLGSIFSSGFGSAGNTVFNNLAKGNAFYQGLGLDALDSMSSAAVGIGANYLGKGLNSLAGDSMLSRGLSQGLSTGIGSIGGQAVTNLLHGKNAFLGIKDSVGAIKAYHLLKNSKDMLTVSKDTFNSARNAANIGKMNLAGMAGNIVGQGLSAALGPSKEYGGKYGGVTQTMDTVYDLTQSAIGFVPGWGTFASGIMSLNKGLGNLFGSTDGMTVQDAILGSAFMPAPVKWLNMAGANTTDSFKNQSWQNMEKANSFMGNAFGNLGDKFDLAREESNKTYGTFSKGAYRDALDNISFANSAWNDILAMADLNEILNIRSQYMSSINNQRYALNILGGWSPMYRGKQGMKILNNATNHKIGMRLLSGAALIDNKQMILCSAVD